MKITLPEKFTHQYFKSILNEMQLLFRSEDKLIEGVFLDASNIRKVNILGILLIYKFLEYAILKNCFNSPKCNVFSNTTILEHVDKYGFKPFMQMFVNCTIPLDYSIKFNKTDGIFIAPMVLHRGLSKEKTEEQYKSKIRDYYNYDSQITFAVLQCVGEIASNFSEHAVDDTKSILVASGNRDYFEIACADTGNGVVSTLSPCLEYEHKRGYQVLTQSILRGISSKLDDGHMGYGLWLINQFVEGTGGELLICSEGAYLYRRGKRIDKGESGYWKGTIVYLRIYLTNKLMLQSVIDNWKRMFLKHKIQRV